jgi:hypothetical protein
MLLLLFSGRYIPPDPSPERTATVSARNRIGEATSRARIGYAIHPFPHR